MTAVVRVLGVVEIRENREVAVRTFYIAKNNGVEWTQEGMSWLVGNTYNAKDMILATRLAGAVTAGKVWENIEVRPGRRPDDPPRIVASNNSVYGNYLDVSLKKLGF